MKYDDPYTAALLLNLTRLVGEPHNEALRLAIASLSTLKALASVPFIKTKIDALMKVNIVEFVPACGGDLPDLEEKEKGKRKRRNGTIKRKS